MPAPLLDMMINDDFAGVLDNGRMMLRSCVVLVVVLNYCSHHEIMRHNACSWKSKEKKNHKITNFCHRIEADGAEYGMKEYEGEHYFIKYFASSTIKSQWT